MKVVDDQNNQVESLIWMRYILWILNWYDTYCMDQNECWLDGCR